MSVTSRDPDEGTMERVRRFLEPHRGGRFAALDGYRAVAAIGVLVYHVAGNAKLTGGGSLGAAFLNNLGNYGVAVFFLLSGFLLYRPFASAHLVNGATPSWRTFWRHRFLRIYPAYWLALTVFIFLVGLRMEKTPANLGTIYLLLQAYRPLFGFAALSVAWTLCIEVAFYLALPFIAAFIAKVLGRSARTLRTRLQAQLLGVAVLYVLALIFRLTVVAEGMRVADAQPRSTSLLTTTHLWLPNYFDWFALGMLLAIAVVWRDLGRPLPRSAQVFADHSWACWVVAALAYFILMVIRSDDAVTEAGVGKETVLAMCLRFFFNGVAAFFFLLPGIIGLAEGSPIKRVMAGVVLAYLGTVSYGIYLWHKLWLDWLKGRPGDPGPGVSWGFWTVLAAVFGLTVVAASVSWFALERPLMRFKDPRRTRGSTRRHPGVGGHPRPQRAKAPSQPVQPSQPAPAPTAGGEVAP